MDVDVELIEDRDWDHNLNHNITQINPILTGLTLTLTLTLAPTLALTLALALTLNPNPNPYPTLTGLRIALTK